MAPDDVFLGESLSTNSGSPIESVGDTDGDGWSDILIGSPSHDNYTGASYLMSGGRM